MSENIPLSTDMRNLILKYDRLFNHRFHCKNFSSIFFLDQSNLSKSTFSNNSQRNKIVRRHPFSHRTCFFSSLLSLIYLLISFSLLHQDQAIAFVPQAAPSLPVFPLSQVATDD